MTLTHIRKRLTARALLALAAAVGIGSTACAGSDAARPDPVGQPDPPALRVEASPEPGGTRLVLTAPPGIRINTRLKPVLELANGALVYFDTSAVSPDSLYFAAPPAGFLWMPADSAHGLLHASVCDDATSACHRVKLEI